jgi:hypothetical protein
MNGADSAIHMAPYTVDKVPNMASRISDGHSVVGTLPGISGCMNDRKNKEDRTGAGI